jgi:nifR3 family TIM-barrel protein
MQGFWKDAARPVVVLAPMADVTDPAFRRVIAKYGKPDVLWTEFVSADGLAFAPAEGRAKLLADLRFVENERPIVAQFFTANPETMEQAARLARELGFDGVDINMGCPDASIEKQGAGAAMMKDHGRAKEVIAAAQQGAGSVPVSVKTRIGFNTVELETWLPSILSTNLAAITIHARTRKEMSKVPARWEYVARAVALRDEYAPNTLILGNGDVQNRAQALERVRATGCDGVMIGRGIFGNPWLWSGHVPTLPERLHVLAEHVRLFQELLPHKSFHIMKKHFKAYVHGFNGAGDLRAHLMKTESGAEVLGVIDTWLSQNT